MTNADRVIREYRALVNSNEEAHRHAWEEARSRIDLVLAHIEDQNLGLARDAIRALLEDLPHDYGAQTFFPLFDRKMELVLRRNQRGTP